MSTPSVLIVDASAEIREVLRTVLARRGLHILEANAADDGLRMARAYHPDVIVLDIEADHHDAELIREQFTAEATSQASRLIVLGKLRRGPTFAGGHVISKPYHFAPLVHTIEQLAAKAA